MVRVYPDKPIVGVGAVIIKNDSILLIKRSQEPGKGSWSIPGGLVNLGEPIRKALIREIKEETDLLIDVGDVAGVFDYIQKDEASRVKYHYVIIDFFVNSFNGSPRPLSDASDIMWVGLEKTEGYPLTSTTRLFLQKFKNKNLSIS